MKLQQYIYIFAFGTAISILTALLLLFTVNPLYSETIGFLVFYLVIFTSTAGFFTTLGTIIRNTKEKSGKNTHYIVNTSIRQGILLALLGVISLLLLRLGIFYWWSMTLLIVAISMFEYIFIAMHHQKSQ